MTVPSRRAVIFAIILAFPLALAGMGWQMIVVALAGDMCILFVWLADRSRLRKTRVNVIPSRSAVGHAGRETVVAYTVENHSDRKLDLVFKQPAPDGWIMEEKERKAVLPPQSALDIHFAATPSHRGDYLFPEPEVTIFPTGGWFGLRRRQGPPVRLLIHPAMEALVDVERMKRGKGMVGRGLRRHRQVGTGSEFERLRTYQPDDDFRHINWKTTARTGKPITNVYQSEKGRDVLLCVDCGRMMGQPAGNGSILDMAVETGMVLARAVVNEGDRLGVVAFRDRVENYLPVKGGKIGVKRASDALAGLEVSPTHTSFSTLATAIGTRQNRRALIIVLTDFNDPQLAEDLADAMRLLRLKHAAVVVSMRDPLLEAVASGSPWDSKDLFRVLAASKFVEERDAAAQDLRRLGVEVVECDSAGMAVAVVDRYLSVKAGRMLD